MLVPCLVSVCPCAAVTLLCPSLHPRAAVYLRTAAVQSICPPPPPYWIHCRRVRMSSARWRPSARVWRRFSFPSVAAPLCVTPRCVRACVGCMGRGWVGDCARVCVCVCVCVCVYLCGISGKSSQTPTSFGREVYLRERLQQSPSGIHGDRLRLIHILSPPAQAEQALRENDGLRLRVEQLADHTANTRLLDQHVAGYHATVAHTATTVHSYCSAHPLVRAFSPTSLHPPRLAPHLHPLYPSSQPSLSGRSFPSTRLTSYLFDASSQLRTTRATLDSQVGVITRIAVATTPPQGTRGRVTPTGVGNGARSTSTPAMDSDQATVGGTSARNTPDPRVSTPSPHP